MVGRVHYAVAALVITLVAAVFALGVYRYADSQRAYQSSQYEALAGAMQLAYAVPDGSKAEALKALQREAASLGHGGRIDRAFFVRKGEKIPSLNISKPARLVVDLGRKDGSEDEEEALITLSARLEKHFSEGGNVATLDHRYLNWTIGALGRRVAAWPVVGADGYLGLAGVELLPTPKPQSPYLPALLGALVFVGLFLAGLYAVQRREAHLPRAPSDRPLAAQLPHGKAPAHLPRAPSDRPLAAQLPHGKALSGRPPESIEDVAASPPDEAFPVGKVASEARRIGPALNGPSQLLFVSLSFLAILAVTSATYLDQTSRSANFVEHRNEVTTRFVNRVAWQDTEGLHHLDSLWNRIFKAPADQLVVSSADPAGANGAVICAEGPQAAADLAWDRTIPVVVVVALALLLGIFMLPGLASLIRGLVTLPGVYAYVAPAMLGMTVLVLVPFIMGVGLGFFNMDYEFVGLENFSDILFPSATSQTNFYYTLGFTILWTVSNVVLHVSLGLFMAMILNSKRVRFRGLFRVLLIIPWAIPNYVTALIWKWMFTSQIGAINLMMEAVGMTPINWFGPTFWTNFFAVLATNTWLGFPFMMVVSLGALQSIPNELYEAADIDGASRWQKFRNVTLPLLKPALFPAIILGTIWTFNMFNIIYLVTRGQPDNKTNILITEAYRFFAELNQYGVAAAYCVLIFFILLGYTLVTNRITQATEGAFE